MTKAKSKLTVLRRFLIIAVSIAVGAAIVATFISKKQPPERIPYVEQAHAVHVFEVAELPLMIEARGFGSSTPAQSWSAVSNVKGHVVFRHEDLESGAILPEGTVLLEIDPSIYQLALAEANADLAGIDAEVAQLNQEAANTEALLELEKQRLALAEVDLNRTEELFAVNAVAQSMLDTQLRATLQQRQAVQALLNQQSILPIQLTRLEAQKDRVYVKRAQIESDLEDTKVIAPFDMRIAEVSVEMHQYINPGQLMFVGDGVEAAEVVLQFSMTTLRRALSEVPATDDGGLNVEGLDAHVMMVGEDQQWDAEVVRVANGIDPATRTVRVTLSVDQPVGFMDPLENPPLPKGAYVEGSLRISAGEPTVIIPQEALHEGWVYLVDADQRLIRREVVVAFQQSGMIIIESGLAVGDLVIIDDISPAVTGMLLDVRRDLAGEEMLAAKAAGDLK